MNTANALGAFWPSGFDAVAVQRPLLSSVALNETDVELPNGEPTARSEIARGDPVGSVSTTVIPGDAD